MGPFQKQLTSKPFFRLQLCASKILSHYFLDWKMVLNHSWSDDKRALNCWVQFPALQYIEQKRPIWNVTWVWSDLTAYPSSYEHYMICLFVLLSTYISSTLGFYRKLICQNFIEDKKKPSLYWLDLKSREIPVVCSLIRPRALYLAQNRFPKSPLCVHKTMLKKKEISL